MVGPVALPQRCALRPMRRSDATAISRVSQVAQPIAADMASAKRGAELGNDPFVEQEKEYEEMLQKLRAGQAVQGAQRPHGQWARRSHLLFLWVVAEEDSLLTLPPVPPAADSR